MRPLSTRVRKYGDVFYRPRPRPRPRTVIDLSRMRVSEKTNWMSD